MPVRARTRTPSPNSSVKRQKRAEDIKQHFQPSLFEPENIAKLAEEYLSSRPYKYCRVNALFQDDLLENVKDECIRELAFTEKETDIYKVFQTGDLASLNYIDEDQLALLPSLLQLRDSLYSQEFRDYLRKVTGCGPLSGSKQDMSVNSYRKGCHLLNHDDVIDTRRVSYILYMPISGQGKGEREWKSEWGGALELYNVTEKDGIKEPVPFPAKAIPPSWNQFIFFEVQPGHSFHSVQEVLVGDEESDDHRQRLSISGWFHKPQEGEDGYGTETAAETAAFSKSSLQQLSSSREIIFGNYPPEEQILPATHLTAEEISFLSEYLNPAFLKTENLSKLSEYFGSESYIRLQDFLNEPLANKLQQGIRKDDESDGYYHAENATISPHTSGYGKHWGVTGPPHKFRYCVLSSEDEKDVASPYDPEASHIAVLRTLQDKLFPSSAFRAWLALLTTLIPRRHHAIARRFRPGLDYTLAISDENESRLDVVLCLTPDDEEHTWSNGNCGGWECYMAPDDGDEDPAVYRSNKKTANGVEQQGEDGEIPEDDEDEDEEPGTLLTQLPSFNSLLVVLRDERVLHFVKYVSAEAQGSRWDVCGEYEVDMVKEEIPEGESG